MQITAFKAILAWRINKQGCKDYENTVARVWLHFEIQLYSSYKKDFKH